MSKTPTRDWLAGAVREAWRKDCPSCGYGFEGDVKLTCPAHAAEAVCEAVRQERLFIMPQADADGLYADVQQRATEVGRREIREMVGAEADRLEGNGGKVSAAWVASGLRHIASYGCPGPRATGRTCVHEGGER